MIKRVSARECYAHVYARADASQKKRSGTRPDVQHPPRKEQKPGTSYLGKGEVAPRGGGGRVEIVAELGGLARAMEGATLAFTGEGRMDAQTLRGKTPAGVARIAHQAGVPVVALAGSLGEGYEALHGVGISAAFSLAPGPITLQRALADAERLLHDRARDVMQLWMAAQKRML